MRRTLALFCLALLTACVCVVTWHVRAVLRATEYALYVTADVADQLPAQIETTRDVLDARLEALQRAADGRVASIERRADERLASLQDAAKRQLAGAIERADARLSEISASVSGNLGGFRADVQPVLANSAALTANLNDSLTDTYWDLKASLESATVAARGVAEAAEAIGKTAPQTTQATARLAEHAAGIAEDVHTVTARYVAPQPWYKRLVNMALGGLLVAVRIF